MRKKKLAPLKFNPKTCPYKQLKKMRVGDVATILVDFALEDELEHLKSSCSRTRVVSRKSGKFTWNWLDDYLKMEKTEWVDIKNIRHRYSCYAQIFHTFTRNVDRMKYYDRAEDLKIVLIDFERLEGH